MNSRMQTFWYWLTYLGCPGKKPLNECRPLRWAHLFNLISAVSSLVKLPFVAKTVFIVEETESLESGLDENALTGRLVRTNFGIFLPKTSRKTCHAISYGSPLMLLCSRMIKKITCKNVCAKVNVQFTGTVSLDSQHRAGGALLLLLPYYCSVVISLVTYCNQQSKTIFYANDLMATNFRNTHPLSMTDWQ